MDHGGNQVIPLFGVSNDQDLSGVISPLIFHYLRNDGRVNLSFTGPEYSQGSAGDEAEK